MKERNIALAIIFTIITCGIYGIYWFIVLNDEAKSYSEDATMVSGGVAFLLTLITCGIYGIYWVYRMGKAIEMAQSKNGLVATDNSVLYLILELFGLGIVVWDIIQSDLNTITRTKNGVAPQAQ